MENKNQININTIKESNCSKSKEGDKTGFAFRDKNIKNLENEQKYSFEVVRNDWTDSDKNIQNLKILTDLKNIISKQLPKMPNEYITRLVFDKLHESMVIISSKYNNFII